jgi:predicted ATP-grasp superfamily ATP-dependent carboligase
VTLPTGAAWQEAHFQAGAVTEFNVQADGPGLDVDGQLTITRAETVRILGGCKTVVDLEPGRITVSSTSGHVVLGKI